MNIGKQSTLNDMRDLKEDLEAKIAAAAAIKADQVSQIESGSIDSGSIYDTRPTGVYSVSYEVFKPALAGNVNHGKLFLMGHSNVDNVGFYVDWKGEAAVFAKMNNVVKVSTLLTSNNTITDSNGFIKAA